MPRVLRIGHRGAAGHAPENTLAADSSEGSNSAPISWKSTCAGRQTASLLLFMMRLSIEQPTGEDGSMLYRLEKSGRSTRGTGSISRRLKRCSRWLQEEQD